MITRKHITQSYNANNQKVVSFELTVDWDGVSYDSLNSILDDPDEVEDGHLLRDVCYKPIFLNKDGTLTFEVHVSDLTAYFDEEYMSEQEYAVWDED